MRIWPVLVATGLLLSLQGCSSSGDEAPPPGPTPDGGGDAESEAAADAGGTGGADGGADAGATGGAEAGAPDAADATTGGGAEAGSEGGGGADGGGEAAADAGLMLSAEAQQGLAISPVAISVAGKSAADAELIGRGSYLVNAVAACNDCHQTTPADGGAPKFMAGGQMYALGPAGTVHARNLTPDPNTGLKLTEAQFIQVMRTGADFHPFSLPAQGDAGAEAGAATDASVPAIDGAAGADGGAVFGRLLVMPWPVYRWMSTRDLRAIYAYLKAIPAVPNAVPEDMKMPIPPAPVPTTYDEGVVGADGGPGRPLPQEDLDPDNTLRGLAIQPLDPPPDLDTRPPEQQQLFARGSYLVNAVAACNDCHTNPDRDQATLKINTDAYLSGGRVFDVPPPLQTMLHQRRTMSANLTGAAHGFKESYPVFKAMIQSGRHVEEQAPSDAGALPIGWPMPWMTLRNMTETDLQSVYTYITSVPRRTGAADKITQQTAWFCGATADCAPFGGGTCNTATHECLMSCMGTGLAEECGACQMCNAMACAAPDPSSTCLTTGIP